MSNPLQFRGFVRHYSTFQPPLLTGPADLAFATDMYRARPPALDKTAPSSNRQPPSETTNACRRYRNWMVENEDDEESVNSNDSTSSPVRGQSSSTEADSDLPSPSHLTFFSRKKRDSKKERRARTTFSSQQTQLLELEYQRSEYVTRPRRYELATQLCLKEVQIKIWYQNRRAKDKRIEKATWDRQYRCLALTRNSRQLPSSPSTTGNYGLNPPLTPASFPPAPLRLPLHMFPTSAASFPLPLLQQVRPHNSN
ncbi:hypothetical protein RvY_18240 [Ramazzottius varieornatus]|uniref:Homeobox domain-containing protein n=1 Tax=Ramazzottius varieornatus TaxID=947166 RepID=A0A1D1WA51_RAMVA|nr:hypothetical protein RvY_18240 [Ramazzottius varieornatus]